MIMMQSTASNMISISHTYCTLSLPTKYFMNKSIITIVIPIDTNSIDLGGYKFRWVKCPSQVLNAKKMHTGKANKNGVKNFNNFIYNFF